jgi:GAF domain-containing protein
MLTGHSSTDPPIEREQVVPRDATDPQARLTFPDLPRLELDELLTQLVDRAHEVQATQGRLRGLLHANQLINADLALPAVLRRIAEAARELVGARYAALGVIAGDGGLAEFVHSGMPADAVDRIGHLPQGKGLLGALIDDPRPIRLARIAADERSTGFPPGHPAMDSFLGVPIRIRDEVFGNLYLTESLRGGFTAEDEELAKALAATAAAAVDNARLYASARSRGEWLEASAEITRELLAPGSAGASSPLRLVAEHSRRIAGADLVTIMLPVEATPGSTGAELVIDLAVGTDAEDLPGTRLPVTGSVSGQALTTGRPLRVADLHGIDDPAARVPVPVESGPVLAVPLCGPTHVHGVLWMTRLRGRPAFTAADADLATGFANQAAVAIELAAARTEQNRTALLDDRDRIATDLRDHVIQQLFSAGLSLHGIAAQAGPGPPAEAIRAVVAELDATIARIRSSVFDLGTDQPEPPAKNGHLRLA